MLLYYGADVNYQDPNGWAPIHYAAFNGHCELLKLLIANGASLSVKLQHGETALHCAVSQNKEEAAKILIANGADVNGSRLSMMPLRKTTMNYAYCSYRMVPSSMQRMLME